MGWDAYSNAPYSQAKGNKFRCILKHKKHREAFKAAVEIVRKNSDKTVDGYLSHGGLDCSACYKMLQKAAEKSAKNLNWGLAWEDEGMQPKFVKVMHLFLNWDFKYKKEDAWAYWSAKEFVRVCAEQELSIRFTY